MLKRRAFLGVIAGGLLAAPLAAEAQQVAQVPTRRTSSASLVSRAGVAVIGLAAFGCVSATDPGSQSAVWALLAFLLVGGALYLVVSGILVVVSRRRRHSPLEARQPERGGRALSDDNWLSQPCAPDCGPHLVPGRGRTMVTGYECSTGSDRSDSVCSWACS